jgi:hypothetical protein
MNPVKHFRYLILALILIFSISCSAVTSLLNNSGTSSQPSLPTVAPLATSSNSGNSPSSPLAGKWIAVSDLGKFLLTIDPTGENVTAVAIELNNWKCGGTLLTTQLTVQDTWAISDSQLSVDFYLDSDEMMPLTIEGSYDQQYKAFTGTWNVDAYGTTCSGTWKATR